jgi:hypothetical protein
VNSESITSVAISHDQNCMLVSCLDGRLRLFDRSCGELLKEYDESLKYFLFNHQMCCLYVFIFIADTLGT